MVCAIKQPLDGRKNWIIVTVWTFASLLVGLFLIPFAPIMPELGLDPSWRYAINQAVAQHLVFGRDFIFTVGPLGSVYAGYYHPETDAVMLAGSALLALGLCAGCAMLAHPRRHLNAIALPLICGACLSRDVFFSFYRSFCC